MKTIVSIQARMTSNRLPGKPLVDLCGKPAIQWLIERMRSVPGVDEVVVSTRKNVADDPLAEYVNGYDSALTYRGPDADCLGLNYEAAEWLHADIVVLVGADDVLTDPELTRRVVEEVQSGAVYSETRHMPIGTGVRAVTIDALRQAMEEATLPLEREHVTGFFDKRPKRFPVKPVYYGAPGSVDLYPLHRWTIDTPADLELHRRLFAELPPDFTLEDVLALVALHPDWEEPVRDVPLFVPDRTPVDGTPWRTTRYGNVPVKFDPLRGDL